MATAVVMPQLGNSVESSIILNWHKQIGDVVAEGDTLCEVETDKATVDVESPVSGTLLATFFKVGDDVPVKTTIAAVGEPGESYEDLRPDGAAAAPAPTAAPEPAPAASAPAPVPPSAVPDVNGGSARPTAVSTQTVSGEAAGISPRARNLAAERSVDASGLAGTGPGGRIIERDVQAAIANQPKMTPLARSMVEAGDYVAPTTGSGSRNRITTRDLQPVGAAAPSTPSAPAATTAVDDEVEVIAVKGVRKVIAQRMLESLQTTAQLTLNASADARPLQVYRKHLKASPEALGLQKVTINDLLMFVVIRTLPQFPEMNATFMGDTINRYKNIHLGFAVDTDRGLLVPVVRNANLMSLRELAGESRRLATAANTGSIQPDELSGATFTVTNLGNLGIENFTPVLNPPEVGILGVGSINLKPVDVDGSVKFVPHIGLSLTINHQAVDGAPAARFLHALTQNIAQLDLILAL